MEFLGSSESEVESWEGSHAPPFPFSAQAQDGALLVDVTKKPGASTNPQQSAVRSDDIDLDSQLNLEIAVECLPFVSASQS